MATRSTISSQASAAGQQPCSLSAGQQLDLFGPDPVRASHSAQPENKQEQTTLGTCGQSGSGSSDSITLTSCLVSRLQTLSGMAGSMEYRQTWKQKHTPSGMLYSEHIASTPRTKDSDSGGLLKAGYPTPNTRPELTNNSTNRGGGVRRPRNQTQCLGEVAQLMPAGWVTPAARDHKDSPGMATESTDRDGKKRSRLDQLPRQVFNLLPGMQPDGSTAETTDPAELNPGFSLWLMGYPAEWLCSGVQAMQSFRK